MSQSNKPSENVLVRCCFRGNILAGLWVAVLLVAGLLSFFVISLFTGPPRPLWDVEQMLILIGIMGALMGMPIGLCAALIMRTAYVAAVDGLYWRGLGRWRHAAWEEVTDYYEEETKASSSGSHRFFCIKTTQGTISLNVGACTNLLEMRACVQQNAMAAKSWNVWQERPEEWPQTFGYDTRKYRNAPAALMQWHAFVLVAVVVWFVWQWVRTHTAPNWAFLLTPTGVFLLIKELILAGLHPSAVATRRRLSEQICINGYGVRWDGGTRHITAAWEDITDFYTVSGLVVRSVVVTKNGTFDFLRTLGDYERLQRIIPKYAVNAGQVGWRTDFAREKTIQIRGDAQAARVYHYRTGAAGQAALVLTLPYAFIAAVSAYPLIQVLRHGPMPLNPLAASFAAFFCLWPLFLLWALLQMLTVTICTDADGITRRSVFGSQCIPWNEVQDFHWSGLRGLDIGNIVGAYGRIRFWNGITDSEKLAEEIVERAAFLRRQDEPSMETPG